MEKSVSQSFDTFEMFEIKVEKNEINESAHETDLTFEIAVQKDEVNELVYDNFHTFEIEVEKDEMNETNLLLSTETEVDESSKLSQENNSLADIKHFTDLQRRNMKLLCEEDEDAKKLAEWLQVSGLENVLPYLQTAKVTFRSLQYLDRDDIKEAIPPLGLRAEFRSKLFAWKKKEFGIDDDTASRKNEINKWVHESSRASISSQAASPAIGCLNKDLSTLLTESAKGRVLLEFCRNNHDLKNSNRDELISLIVEETICNNIQLKPHDFATLVEEICTIFPKEKFAQEYYFIPRKGKKNPCGRLYQKYVNSKVKKRRTETVPPVESTVQSTTDAVEENSEIDSSVALALKVSLSRDTANWNDVCDKWKKTFVIRRKELSTLSDIEFLNAWPIYADSRSLDLMKIDFSILYPNKEHLLYAKWDKFKESIKKFYETELRNDYCKELFGIAKSTSNKDSQDYIFATLLNGVLPCSARFKDSFGKCSRKATIADAQESFAVRLLRINDYEKQIDELVSKYFSSGLTVQPFLLVEGHSDAEEWSESSIDLNSLHTEIKIEEDEIDEDQSTDVTEHKISSVGKKVFQCDTCNKTFTRSSDFIKHERIHSGEKPYECNICTKTFTTSSNLKRHEKIHSGEKPYECNICSKTFNHLGNLKKHKTIHSGEKPYECKICFKTFTHSGNLKAHEKIHSGEKPYECNICSKTFKDLGNLKRHKIIHSGEKSYECKICSKTFTHSGNLKAHEKWHSGEKPYECNICSKTFKDLGNLKRHKIIHSGEKPYECNICSKTFNDISNLKKHKIIHSGEKRYECNICSKTCATSGALKKHERIHSGEKPNECNVCSKTFNQSSSLKAHERIHSGEKPYKCKICSKTFTTSGNLKTHKRIHSGENSYELTT